MNSCGTKSNSDTVPTSMPPIVATASEREPLQPTPVENIIGSFDQDSYGYRPNRSASDAIAKARERCFKFGWVLDMDISKFFDTIDHDLLMKAVECHVREKWVLLYIRRWLKVPYRTSKGETIERTMGVPQGSVIGPVLANLFLHYTFDKWMRIHYPHIPFERYADDTICHCVSKAQAEYLKEVLTCRFEQCRLKLNVEKTKIVQCPTSTRKKVVGSEASFDFLGYTFRCTNGNPRNIGVLRL